MWPAPRSEERRPSRPPSGRGSGGMSSNRSLSGLRNYSDDDDNSSCDDTYVSMSSSRGRIVDDGPSKHSINGRESSTLSSSKSPRRILGETLRASNNTAKSSRLSSRLSSSKNKYEGSSSYGDDSSSVTSTILDKLKSDINSLEQLRSGSSSLSSSTLQQQHNQTITDDFPETFSENEFSRARSIGNNNNNNRSKSSMRSSTFDRAESDYGSARRSMSSMRGGRGDRDSRTGSSDYASSRSLSVDRFFRDTDLGETTKSDSSAKQSTSSNTSNSSPWEIHQKKEKAWGQAIENDELVKKCRLLEHEKKRLQETVRNLKEESIVNIEHAQNKLTALSNVKVQLEESKEKEVELSKALRELIGNAECEQENMSEELRIAYKLRESEVTLLEEKLKCASEEMEKKVDIIRELESEMHRVETSLKQEKSETVEHLCEKIENLETSMKSNEDSLMEKLRELSTDLENSRSSYAELAEKKNKLSQKLSEAEEEARTLHENIDRIKKEGQEAIEAVQQSLNDTKEVNKVLSEEVDAAKRENQDLTNTIEGNTGTIVTLEQSLSESKMETSQLINKLSKIEDENGSLKYVLDKRNEAIQTLEEGLAKANLSKCDTELELNETRASLENEKQILVRIKNEQAIIVKRQEKRTSELEEEKQKLMSSLSESDQTETELKSSLERAKCRNVEMKGKVAKAEKEMNTLNAAVQEKDQQISSLVKSSSLMQQQVDQAAKEIDTLRGKVQSKDKQLVDVKRATELLHQKTSSLTSELETYKKKKLPACEAEVKKLKVTLAESDTKVNIMNQEVSSLQAELHRVNERLESSKAKNDELNKSSVIDKSDMKKKEATIQKLQSELDKAKADVEQADAKVAKIRIEGASRNGQLKSALQSLDEMMRYIESMRGENDDVVASLESDLEKSINMKQEVEKILKQR